MGVVRKFHIPTEVRKVMKGKKTKVSLESIVLAIGPHYLEMLKDAEAQAGERADLDELERMFRLEDSRP